MLCVSTMTTVKQSSRLIFFRTSIPLPPLIRMSSITTSGLSSPDRPASFKCVLRLTDNFNSVQIRERAGYLCLAAVKSLLLPVLSFLSPSQIAYWKY